MFKKLIQFFGMFGKAWEETPEIKNVEKIIAQCGHETSTQCEVDICGHKVLLGLHEGTKSPTHCLNCYAKMCIICGWCRLPILIDHPITLYTPRDPNWQLPEGARWYDESKRIVVGCLRWSCADTGADRSGFWVLPGKVQRVVSPFEECMMTHNMVITSDLSDKKEAIKPQEN